MKVLVVDDEVDTVETLEEFLKIENCTVFKAYDGKEGLKQCVVNQPDLILLDIRLPDEDGIKVLEKMKQADPQVSVVMITGYKDAEKVVEAFRLGALDCILKPFNFEYLKMQVMPKVKRR